MHQNKPPHSNQYGRVCLIGCGKMGGALLEGWLAHEVFSCIDVVDPHFSGSNNSTVTHYSSLSDLADSQYDLIVLAVKPQILAEVCDQIRHSNLSGAFLSIAAGWDLTTLSKYLSDNAEIVRCMPNTPAAIGKGVSVAISSENTSQKSKDIVDAALGAVGLVKWINDESLMDAVTALSGSGPAYVFYFIEALAKAGIALGLDDQTAMSLARQTVIGSGALAEADNDISAADLRKNVTSPGGTTQAALEVLMDGRFDDLLKEALSAAKNRSIALRS